MQKIYNANLYKVQTIKYVFNQTLPQETTVWVPMQCNHSEDLMNQ